MTKRERERREKSDVCTRETERGGRFREGINAVTNNENTEQRRKKKKRDAFNNSFFT